MDVTDEERREAYRKARRASDLLDEAAVALGVEDVQELANVARDDDVPDEMRKGARAVTNAYSYLNNGMLEYIHPDG